MHPNFKTESRFILFPKKSMLELIASCVAGNEESQLTPARVHSANTLVITFFTLLFRISTFPLACGIDKYNRQWLS